MSFKHLTDSEIQKLTFGLKTLDYKQRGLIRELLNKLQSGGIGEQELRRELRRLREEHVISETDRRAIEKGIFADE